MHLTAGQVSDYIGAGKLIGDLPAAKHLVADRGYACGLVQKWPAGKGDHPLHSLKEEPETPDWL